MRRRIGNIIALLSMLMLVGVVALDIRSYFVADQFGYMNGKGDGLGISTALGAMQVIIYRSSLAAYDHISFSHSTEDPDKHWVYGKNNRPLGAEPFYIVRTNRRDPYARFPIWLVCPVVGAPGFLILALRRISHWRNKNRPGFDVIVESDAIG